MMEWDAFRGVTLRALRIDYISPAVCELIASSSGSSGADSALLEVIPTTRAVGPSSLTVSVDGGVVNVSWPSVSGAYAYAVYLSLVSAEGPFVIQTANILNESFSYASGPGTFWIKITAIEPNFGETFPSPTVQFVV